MLNLSIALMKVFNPRRKGKLAPINEPLLLMPGHKLARLIREGQLSSEHLCGLVAERLKQVQPHLNAMCQERFAEAFEEARQIDALVESVRSGARRRDELSTAERELLDSPLLGVPVSVKESIRVRGMRNSGGLYTRRAEVADEDAVVVRNVRHFGMVPICTSNVPELTLFWADCQNTVYGRSVNPYDWSRITGASSGGEGALLGAGASLIGLGSDIGGSLRIPAHYCGVFSHKPSPFLVSSEGNYPEVKPARLRMFTLGPMCRYASDLRPLLKCLLRDQANAKRDTYFKHQPADIGQLREQLIAKLDEHFDLRNLRVLYFDFNEASCLRGNQSVRVQEELMRGQRDVLEHLTQQFNVSTEHFNLDKYLKKILITWQCLLRCARKDDRDESYEDNELEKMFGIDSIALEFLKMPFGLSKHTKESLLTLIVGSAIPKEREKAYELCEKFELHAQELRNELHEKLNCSRQDGNRERRQDEEECVLIMPTLPTVAYKHNVSLAKTPDIRFPSLFNVLELPVTHATIRLDKAHGLPYGVSIAARPYADHVTLAVAEEIESAFGGWVPPSSAAAEATEKLAAGAPEKVPSETKGGVAESRQTDNAINTTTAAITVQ